MASPATSDHHRSKQPTDTPVYLVTVVIMVAVALLGGIVRSQLRTVLRDQLEDRMATVLAVSHEAAATWHNQQQRMADTWSDAAAISVLTEGLLSTEPTRDGLLGSPHHAELSSVLATPLSAMGYVSYLVIGRDGLILSSSRESRVGARWTGSDRGDSLRDIWAAAPEPPVGIWTQSEPDGQAVVQFASLISNATGDAVATLILETDPSQGFSSILQQGRLGDSGETYAIDSTGILISQSRFEAQLVTIGLIDTEQSSALNVSVRDPGVNLVLGEPGATPVDDRPLTRMAASITAGRSGSDFDGYRDYRGVEVVGAWLWDGYLDLGLAVEIDAAEAFAVVNDRGLITVAVTIASEILILIAGALFIRYRRIQKTRIAIERKHRSITNAASDAIISADGDGVIHSWNPAAEVMFGYPAEQMIGEALTTLVPDRFQDAHRKGIRRIQEGATPRPPGPVELVGRHRLGAEFPIELSLNTWESIEGTNHSAFIRDITERVRAETERAEQQEDLRALLASKDRLVASVSHELRTPLTSIIGFTELLLTERDSFSSDDLDAMIETVAAESIDLAAIVEDLLVAARTDLEKVPMRLERIDLATTTQTTLDRMSDSTRGGLVSIAGNAVALADQGRVRQIVRNLVTNAARYGGGNTHVEIAQEGDWSMLAVRDGGEAIPDADRGKLFEPYGLAHQETNDRRSIGLGLSVSLKLAHLMGGDLTYRHEDGESIFELSLPVASDGGNRRQSPEDTSPGR